jgi:hypothetical protein
VQITHCNQSFSWKSVQAGFLLANGSKRCRADTQNMQSLPVCGKASVKVRVSFPTCHAYLAIAALGHGHRGSITHNSRQLQICRGNSRVFHQVVVFWNKSFAYLGFPENSQLIMQRSMIARILGNIVAWSERSFALPQSITLSPTARWKETTDKFLQP